jgi:hypothetical protein
MLLPRIACRVSCGDSPGSDRYLGPNYRCAARLQRQGAADTLSAANLSRHCETCHYLARLVRLASCNIAFSHHSAKYVCRWRYALRNGAKRGYMQRALFEESDVRSKLLIYRCERSTLPSVIYLYPFMILYLRGL